MLRPFKSKFGMDQKEILVRDILPKILNHQDLRDVYKMEHVQHVRIGGIGGDNNFMISSLFTSTIEFLEGKELKVVIKQLDQSEEIKKEFGMDIMFSNEIAAYDGVLELLRAADMFPRCYYSRPGGDAIVVMQDIRPLGFRMSDSMTWLSKQHVLLAVRKLGVFHGKCYTLKETDRKEFERICGLFQECRYQQDPSEESGTNLVFSKCAERGLLRLEQEVCGDTEMETFLKEVQNLFSNPMEYCTSLIKPKGPLSVLCHGDYTRNNVMFSYDEFGEPDDLMMIDLQTFRWASPATDLSVFLFLHYQATNLMTEWDEIFTEYHKALIQELCAGLNKSKNDLPEYYSISSMGRDFSEYCLHGFFTASYFLCFLHEPLEGDTEEFFGPNTDPELVLHETMTRGGETVTQALSGMLTLTQKLQKRYGYVNNDLHNNH